MEPGLNSSQKFVWMSTLKVWMPSPSQSLSISAQPKSRSTHQSKRKFFSSDEDTDSPSKPPDFSQNPPSSCPICLGNDIHQTQLVVLRLCMHQFCAKCIHTWSALQRKCPLCKREFDGWFYDIQGPGNYREKCLLPLAETPEPSVNRNAQRNTDTQRSLQYARGQILDNRRRTRPLPRRRFFGHCRFVSLAEKRRLEEAGAAEKGLKWRASLYFPVQESTLMMASSNPQFPLWKHVDRTKPPKGAGGTATIKCHLCQAEWKGSYTRVKAHFMNIAKKGVDACPGDPDDPTRLPTVQREQQRADGVGKAQKQSSRLTRVVGSDNDESNEDEVPSDDQVHGNENVPSKASKTRSNASNKRNKMCGTGGIHDMFDVKGREGVDLAIARFFLACGIPFNAARSPYFEQMVRAINDGPTGYKPPGYEKLRTALVDKEKARLEKSLAGLKGSWYEDGCSIVMDGWTDCRNRPLINIIVSSVSGPYFLRAIDCTGQEKNAMFLKEQLCDAIAEVGPSNVVQVITDAAPVCKAAGVLVQKQYRHIFWTPCAVHSLNNALKDIGKLEWIRLLIENGRKIQMFICNHHHSQAIYRRHAKLELLKPADTRFATYYILLRRLVEVKGALAATVISDTWDQWRLATSDIAVEVKRLILDDRFWADVKFVVEFVEPICDMLRYADTDGPCLGEIYENMDSMCERIRSIVEVKDPNLWVQLQTMIHGRWNKLNNPLHMAAYAVNPKWYDPSTGRRPPSQDREVVKGFMAAVKKIYGSTEEASEIRSQFAQFSRRRGVFASRDSLNDRRKKKDPIDWWWLHGNDTTELQQFAIRLLGQVASSSSCERNWSTYSFIHSVKRNRLGSKKAENLVYIHSTLRLIARKDPGYKEGPFKRWDQFVDDATCVDDEIQPDGLVEIPPVDMDEDMPQLESDDYIENLLAENLDDNDSDGVDVDDLDQDES